MLRPTLVLALLAAAARAECLQGCRICNANNDCVFCDFELNYALVGANCKVFNVTNCALLDPVGICLACTKGFALDPFTSACAALPSGTALPSCLAYAGPTECTLCEPGFYVLNGNCQAVDAPILNCQVANSTDPTRCATCNPGFVTDHDQRACLNLTAVPNCAGYSVFRCNACADGYLLDLNMNLSSARLATTPARRFFIQAQFLADRGGLLDQGTFSTCNPVQVSNCLEFHNVFNCSRCQPGYYLQAGECIPFPKPIIFYCAAYADERTCLDCRPGYYLINATHCEPAPASTLCRAFNTSAPTPVCTLCFDAYFLNADKICQSRATSQNILNCAALSTTSDTCALCRAGFNVTDDQLACLPQKPNCAVYAPSSYQTVLFECRTCEKGYYLADAACTVITIPNCVTAVVASGTVTCTGCLNKFYVAGGACVAQPTVANCSDYSQSSYNRCARCQPTYFLFEPSNICQESVYLPSCVRYQSSTACAQCKDGFYVNNGVCDKITQIPNCLQMDAGKCSKCEPGYVITTDDALCALPEEFFSLQCDSNNADGYVTEADVFCNYCKKSALPLSYWRNFVCTSETDIPAASLMANCVRYNYIKPQTAGTSGTYLCIACASGYFLDASGGVCVASCTTVTATPYTLGMEVRNNVPSGSTTYRNFDVTRRRVCVSGSYPNCRWVFPDLFDHPADGRTSTYACGACNTGAQPIAMPNRSIYFDTSASVAAAATNMLPVSPVRTFPAVQCVLEADLKASSSASALLTDCDMYYLYDGTYYGCYRCKMGMTGNLWNPRGLTTPLPIPAVIQSCVPVANCAADSANYDIFASSLAEVSAYNIPLGFLFTCRICTVEDTIPVLSIFLPVTAGKVPSYNLFGNPGSLTFRYNNVTNQVNPPLNCRPYTLNTEFGIPDLTNLKTVANCGLAVQNIYSVPNAAGSLSDAPLANTTGLFCYACAPGYRPTRASTNPTHAPLMVTACNAIDNCSTEVSTWFNACSNCTAGFTYFYDVLTDRVAFDTCVAADKNPDCFALDNTGATPLCIICIRGYTLNRDGQCEAFRAENCNDPVFNFNRTYNAQPVYDQHSVGFYMMALGAGCQSCKTGFVSWNVTNDTMNTYCTYSRFLEVGTWKTNPFTNFVRNCEQYGWDRTLKKAVCMVCATGYIRTTAGDCTPSIDNCRVAQTTSGLCAECSGNFINVNGVCKAKAIANCVVYGDSSQLNTQLCKTCVAGYYPQGATCVQGNVPNCVTYSSQDNCLQCRDSFAVVSGFNSKPYCFPVPASLNCLAADPSFQNGVLQCNQCAAGYAISTTLSLIPPTVCLPIVPVPNCQSYSLGTSLASSRFTCNNCTDAFYLAGTNNCTRRSIVFRQCDTYSVTSDTCARCVPGYFLSAGNTTCLAYPTGIPGCINYTSATNCTQCDKSMFFNGTWCTPVPDAQLVTNCDYYRDAKTCLTCANNYALVSGACLASSATNCLTWQSPTACGSCYAGYGFQTTSGIRNCVPITDAQCITYAPFAPFSCSLCKPGYYPLNGVCTEVTTTIQFCLVYDSPRTCLRCDSTSILNPGRTLCLKTPVYYPFFDIKCTFMAILAAPVCNRCAANYYFINDTCTLCPNATMNQGCYYCNPLNTAQCLACKKGYFQRIDTSCVDNNFKPTTNATNGTNTTANGTNRPNTTNTTNFTGTNGTIAVWRVASLAVLPVVWFLG